jgi:hypothetical protein
MGLIQHEQIGRLADGTEHGMRAGSERNSSQHTLTGAHIHLVSSETEIGVSLLRRILVNAADESDLQDDCGLFRYAARVVGKVVKVEPARSNWKTR